METFDDLQRGIIQIILDYHKAKTQIQSTLSPLRTPEFEDERLDSDSDHEKETSLTSSAEQNTWIKVGNLLDTPDETSLIDTLLTYDSTRRDAALDVYINQSTQTTTTRKSLLIQLKEILTQIDQAKAIDYANTSAREDSYQQLMLFLTTLQNNAPHRGEARVALDTFFNSLSINIDTMLTSCFIRQDEHFKIAMLEARLKTQDSKITALEANIEALKQEKEDILLENSQFRTQAHAPRKRTSSTELNEKSPSVTRKGFIGMIQHVLQPPSDTGTSSHEDHTEYNGHGIPPFSNLY